MIHISAQFDSGAIEGPLKATDDEVCLGIRQDSASEFRQWFHFRMQAPRGRTIKVRLTNAGTTTYPDGWPGYQAVGSFDRVHWRRMPTTYSNGELSVDVQMESDVVWLAYFEPYDDQRRERLLGTLLQRSHVSVQTLGLTAQGRPIDLIHVAPVEAEPSAHVWIIARQHPGEPMGEWFAEGLLDGLMDDGTDEVQYLRDRVAFHVVPNMNPDGTALGNLRTNAKGRNLNREWSEPSPEDSAEVFLVRQKMIDTGVDLFIDAHGDEALPYVFVAGCEMLPGFSAEQRAAQDAFIEDLKALTPEFQDVHGYAASRYSKDALKLASKWVGDRFKCVSLTLEMPFKDNAHRPDPQRGWDGQKSQALGLVFLKAIAHALQTSARSS